MRKRGKQGSVFVFALGKLRGKKNTSFFLKVTSVSACFTISFSSFLLKMGLEKSPREQIAPTAEYTYPKMNEESKNPSPKNHPSWKMSGSFFCCLPSRFLKKHNHRIFAPETPISQLPFVFRFRGLKYAKVLSLLFPCFLSVRKKGSRT